MNMYKEITNGDGDDIELEKEKRRLEKLDSKIRLFEQGDLNDDQLESRTYSEVD